jgi:hypothetical protein
MQNISPRLEAYSEKRKTNKPKASPFREKIRRDATVDSLEDLLGFTSQQKEIRF